MRLIDADCLELEYIDSCDVEEYIHKHGVAIPVYTKEAIDNAPTVSAYRISGKDIISRSDAVARITAEQKEEQDIDCIYIYSRCKTIIKHMPSAERTGHWIQQRNEDGWKMWLECSECGGTEQNLSAKFCPHCGARNH